MPEDARYIKVFHQGGVEVRITRDSGKFAASIYEDGVRTDVLTSATPAKLQEKVDRYCNASSLSADLEAAKASVVEAREETAALKKSLNEMGDGNARAAQYEIEAKELDKQIKQLEKDKASLEADLKKCQSELEAARSVKDKN